MVAMTVLAVAIIGVLQVLSLALQTAGHSSAVDQAARLAQSQLALALSVDPTAARDEKGSSDRFEYTVSFASKQTDLMLVSVVISWQERGQPQSYRLSELRYIPASD
jgi:hypothetical protein